MVCVESMLAAAVQESVFSLPEISHIFRSILVAKNAEGGFVFKHYFHPPPLPVATSHSGIIPPHQQRVLYALSVVVSIHTDFMRALISAA